MGKISIHEFMEALNEVLGLQIKIEGAKLLLERINYKVRDVFKLKILTYLDGRTET
jgi:hypothetical protein